MTSSNPLLLWRDRLMLVAGCSTRKAVDASSNQSITQCSCHRFLERLFTTTVQLRVSADRVEAASASAASSPGGSGVGATPSHV